jgi:hypothetical protein
MKYVICKPFKFLLAVTAGMFSFCANGQTTHLVISQAFGGGGITPGYPTNDFVELFNPTPNPISLTGWSLQYALGSNTTWIVINLSGTVQAHAYYLIALGTNNASIGTPLPAADLTAATNIGSINIKLALVNNTTSFNGIANPSASSVDFLGTGTANGYEIAAAPAGSNTTSWLRKANSSATAASMTPPGGVDAYSGNGYDADNNSTDFVTQTSIAARNSSTVLPLVFKGISGTRQGNQVSLNWSVADESDIQYYVVERSVAGSPFMDVAKVNATGAVAGINNYRWTDPIPGAGHNLYRIRAVQTSGYSLYSIVVDVRNNTGLTGMLVYPNPVEGQSFLLHLFNQPEGEYTATLANLSGKVVFKRKVVNEGGIVTRQLITDGYLTRGMYLFRVSNGKTLVGSQVLYFR